MYRRFAGDVPCRYAGDVPILSTGCKFASNIREVKLNLLRYQLPPMPNVLVKQLVEKSISAQHITNVVSPSNALTP